MNMQIAERYNKMIGRLHESSISKISLHSRISTEEPERNVIDNRVRSFDSDSNVSDRNLLHCVKLN
jgi:hypothetical protein